MSLFSWIFIVVGGTVVLSACLGSASPSLSETGLPVDRCFSVSSEGWDPELVELYGDELRPFPSQVRLTYRPAQRPWPDSVLVIGGEVLQRSREASWIEGGIARQRIWWEDPEEGFKTGGIPGFGWQGFAGKWAGENLQGYFEFRTDRVKEGESFWGPEKWRSTATLSFVSCGGMSDLGRC